MSIWRQHLSVQLNLSTPSGADELVCDLSADNTVRTAFRDHLVAATLALVDDSAVYLRLENDDDEPVLFIMYPAGVDGRKDRPQRLQNALLEGVLVHARIRLEFLGARVRKSKSRFPRRPACGQAILAETGGALGDRTLVTQTQGTNTTTGTAGLDRQHDKLTTCEVVVTSN